jgi:uncharacterized protein YjbI with pentapeptide repeats
MTWRPRVWPPDTPAAEALRHWLAGDGEREGDAVLYGLDLDFSGADLGDGDLSEAWLSGSRFHRASLRNACLARAHCEGADFAGADLTDADLSQVSAAGACFRGARLVGANLTAGELQRADFAGADLTGATLGDASYFTARFAGANLTDATADKAALRGAVFDDAELRGLAGTVIGPISVMVRGERTPLDGPDLEQWFLARGARVSRFRAATAP